jgi:hypothetical protein
LVEGGREEIIGRLDRCGWNVREFSLFGEAGETETDDPRPTELAVWIWEEGRQESNVLHGSPSLDRIVSDHLLVAVNIDLLYLWVQGKVTPASSKW